MTEVRSPTEAKGFSSSLCVQSSFEAHPASYPMVIGGPFLGGKVRLGRDSNHSPLPSSEVKNEYELYLPSGLVPEWRNGTALLLLSLLNDSEESST
jgi:hypothetical protein